MGAAATDLSSILVDINELAHYPGNARVGSIDTIRESLRKNGQYRPLVVWKKNNQVLAGNHTWEAAKLEGWLEIWISYVDCDAETAKRINLVDNKAPELGTYNEQALIDQLASMQQSDLLGTGWSTKEVTRLTSHLYMGVGGDTDPAPLPEVTRSHRGDLWLLGDHRLVCGDSTNVEDVAKLFGHQVGEDVSDAIKASCLWTDCPYMGPNDNSSHGDNARPDKVEHSNDSLKQLLVSSLKLADEHLKTGAAIYVCYASGPSCPTFINAFVGCGWWLRQTLVWLKESPFIAGHDYHMRHELIMEGEKFEADLIAYGYTSRQREPEYKGWYGNRKQCSVLEFDRPKLGKLHPTMKPVGLVEVCLTNSTPKQGLVYDPFTGSGTTLIACENLNRRFVGMEIDPGYCDVIVDRWERHTNRKAELSRINTDGSPA